MEDVRYEHYRLPNLIVPIPEVAYDHARAVCGMDFFRDPGQRILDEAEFIFRLHSVREVWIPIDGAPKKHYIFKLE
ncbi:hypothetical protein [Marinimicrobium sp. ABcell2]|uniref:hypothetical protein n=1 Tax=Marinimicrobium sp. ABcell2 TaxID=3069751 RepID=UPI0027B82B22|nr:hypothetical protein [Marinimicrobium sp. ABcell2]MDQ2075160.1 hypothetical protein [Marinimicrobium sp. ABcell2]